MKLRPGSTGSFDYLDKMPHNIEDMDAINAEVAEIHELNITPGSRSGYERSAARLILFFFVTSINLISPIFLLAPPPLNEPTLENVIRFFKMPSKQRNPSTAHLLLDMLESEDIM